MSVLPICLSLLTHPSPHFACTACLFITAYPSLLLLCLPCLSVYYCSPILASFLPALPVSVLSLLTHPCLLFAFLAYLCFITAHPSLIAPSVPALAVSVYHCSYIIAVSAYFCLSLLTQPCAFSVSVLPVSSAHASLF